MEAELCGGESGVVAVSACRNSAEHARRLLSDAMLLLVREGDGEVLLL